MTRSARLRFTAGIGGLLVLLSAPPTTAAAQEDSAGSGDDVCRVFGRVLDSATGLPVVNASVWLEDSNGDFVGGRDSSTDGSYAIEAPACRSGTLRATMLGYRDAAEPVTFEDGPLFPLTLRLELNPVEVETLEVEVQRSARLQSMGFYARKAWEEATGKNYGEFYDTEEFAARAATGRTTFGIAMGSRVRRLYGGCWPAVFIDGKWFRRAESAANMLNYGIQTKEIEGIEVYRAIHGAVPDEFRNPVSNTCGAVVVWTKLAPPADAPRLVVELCEPSDDPNGISFGGIVADAVTGVALPASHVTLTVSRYGTVDDLEARTDRNGRYRYCDIGGWPLAVQARYGSMVAEPVGVDSTRRAPGYWEIDLKLAVVRGGSIVGVVESANPVGTEVAVEGTRWSATPDAEGFFEIHGVTPGDYEVVARLDDEVVARREVSIRSGATVAVTLPVEPG